MRIIIFAGCHDNPVHRNNLRNGLTALNQKGKMPKFIAVEANRALFQYVIRFQRETFYKKAKNDETLKQVHYRYLKELSKSVARQEFRFWDSDYRGKSRKR